jgi:hypothetical protein
MYSKIMLLLNSNGVIWCDSRNPCKHAYLDLIERGPLRLAGRQRAYLVDRGLLRHLHPETGE